MVKPTESGERLLKQPEAAAMLGISASYLRKSACPKVLLPGNGPKGKKIVRYRLADIEAFARRHEVREPGYQEAS